MRETSGGSASSLEHSRTYCITLQREFVVGIDTEFGGQLFPFFRIENGDEGNERTRFTHDESLSKERVGFERQLQIDGRYFFAGTCHDNFLDAAADAQKASIVEFTDVACRQPTVGRKYFGCVFRTVPISFHDGRRTYLNFIGFGSQTQFNVWERVPNGFRLIDRK